MRTIEVKNPELIKGIEETYKLTNKLREESEKAQKILDKFNELREEIGQKVDMIKIDRKDLVDSWEKELGTFEVITNLKKEKGKYIAEVIDEFEEWKDMRKENQKKADQALIDRKNVILKKKESK
jgi:coenzyme F420-reducing hydrogenase alpha subunit